MIKEQCIQSKKEEKERESERRMKEFLAPCPSLGHLTTDEAVLIFSRELFERLVLGLGEQQGRENTRQHEESEDLETE